MPAVTTLAHVVSTDNDDIMMISVIKFVAYVHAQLSMVTQDAADTRSRYELSRVVGSGPTQTPVSDTPALSWHRGAIQTYSVCVWSSHVKT